MLKTILIYILVLVCIGGYALVAGSAHIIQYHAKPAIEEMRK